MPPRKNEKRPVGCPTKFKEEYIEMSWTVVEDGDTLQVRASLKHKVEIKELIAALQRRLDPNEINPDSEGVITTMEIPAQ